MRGGAQFVAALTVGAATQMIHSRIGVSNNALDVLGCIPMIPGGIAANAILGLFAVSAQSPGAAHDTLATALENTLHVAFIFETGLAIPTLLLRVRGMR